MPTSKTASPREEIQKYEVTHCNYSSKAVPDSYILKIQNK